MSASFNFFGPILSFLWNCIGAPRNKNKNFTEVFSNACRTLLTTLIVIAISREAMNLYEMTLEQQQERIKATRLYYEEECATYRGSSQARINECHRNNMIMNTWPITLAIIRLVNTWESCLYLPCTDLARNVADHFIYKVAAILVAVALFSYVFKGFMFTKKKSKDVVDQWRLLNTIKSLSKLQQELIPVEIQKNLAKTPLMTTTTTTSMPMDQQQQQQQTMCSSY